MKLINRIILLPDNTDFVLVDEIPVSWKEEVNEFMSFSVDTTRISGERMDESQKNHYLALSLEAAN